MIKASLEKLRVTIAKTCWKIIVWTSAKVQTNSSTLPDLCATDNATDADQYIDRLNELLINRSKTVREIAITSPYAGGKSSILKTYMRKFPCHIYTCISLSDFNEDTNKTESEAYINKIEKSILQQILYRTSSETTPNSRFRRIFPKPFSYYEAITQASALLIWVAIALISFTSPYWILGALESVSLDTYTFPKEIWITGYLIAIPLLVLKDMIRKLGPVTLTKMNIFQAEIAFDKTKNDSVFNTYLEEIIYYFSVTKSDVVFFEDLDRLEESKIFIKLKELNKLINDSKDVQQDVRFIYAIKDELFTGKNRTKFFDSIIPIIPVSHRSNSYPQLRALLDNSSLLNELTDEFLRDISVYLDDMRMIKNIVTEYGIYKAAYEKKIDKEWHKLFSFIIYKNLYCDDFAKLNNHEGILAALIDSVHGIRNKYLVELEERRNEIKESLIKADQEILANIEELNAIYISIVIKEGNHAPNLGFPYINGTPFTELSKLATFDALYNSPVIVNFNNPQTYMNHNTGKPFNSWSGSMSPSYSERRKILQNKQDADRVKKNEEIRSIEEKLQSLRYMSIKELISEVGKDKVFDRAADKAFIHLVEKGYLDEHYHLYIAHFHEGQLSKSDMDFVMAVKNRSETDTHKTLSNCEEIIKYFSTEDYSSPAIVNPDLINHLLKKNLKASLSEILIHVVIPDKHSLNLLESIIDNVKNRPRFVKITLSEWPEIWLNIVYSKDLTNEKKSELLLKLMVASENDAHEEVGKYISQQNISALIPQDEDKALEIYSKLKAINVRFESLQETADVSFMENILKNEIFLVTFENIAAIFGVLCNKKIETSFYLSDITEGPSSLAKNYVAKNANYFADLISKHRVLLNHETEYLEIFNNEEITGSHKIAIIENCAFQLSSLNTLKDIDELIEPIFTHQRIVPTWKNFATLLEYEEVDQVAHQYLNSNNVIDALSLQETSDLDDETATTISEILLKEEVSLYAFQTLLPKFIQSYSVSQFSDTSSEHLKIYLALAKLDGTASNFLAIATCNRNVALTFLEDKFVEFRKHDSLHDIELSSDDTAYLLKSNKLDSNDKKYLISEKEHVISFTRDTVKLILPILIEPQSANTLRLSVPTLKALLPNIENEIDRILTFINQTIYIDEKSAWLLIDLLGDEYKKFTQAKGSFYLDKSDYNQKLIEALKSQRLISSYSIVVRAGKEVIKVNLKRT